MGAEHRRRDFLLTAFPTERAFCYALCASMGAAACFAWLGIALAVWRPFPYWDAWRTVLMYQAWLEGHSTPWQFFLDHIIGQHNEHRLPFTEIGFWLDYRLFAGHGAITFPLTLIGHIALGASIGVITSARKPLIERCTWILLGCAFSLAPIQIDNLTLTFHIQWFLSALLALWLFATITGMAESPSWRRSTIACTLIFLSPFSSANGLATVAIGLALAFALPIKKPFRIALTCAAVGSLALFFLGYQFNPDSSKFHATLTSTTGLYYFAKYFLALAGGALASQGIPTSCWAGALALLMLSNAVYFLHRHGDRDSATITLAALSVAAAGWIFMTAIGRGGIGSEQALWSRFGTVVAVFWASLLGCVWRMTYGRIQLFIAYTSIGVLAWMGESGQIFIDQAKQRAALIDTTTADLLAGKPDTSGVNPPQLVDFLRRHCLSVFSRNCDPRSGPPP